MYVHKFVPRVRAKGLAGLGSFDFSTLINDVAQAYGTVTAAKSQADIAQAQAQQAQAQAQLVAAQNAAMQAAAQRTALVTSAPATVGGMSMGTILLLGGVALLAVFVLKD